MKESYSYKDILFGLYKEYVMLQEQLDSLNKYVILEENNLDRVSFCITQQIDCDNVKMLCYLYSKLNGLQKMLEKLNIVEYGSFKTLYVDDNNGYYKILDELELINKNHQQEFNQSVWYIFNTDFCKNMKIIHYGVGYDNKPFLSVASRGILSGLFDLGYLDFNSSKDLKLHAYCSKSRLTKEKMEVMLNMEFPKNRFSEYYQNLIEGNGNFGKDVDVYGDFGYSRNGKFEIVPESKRLVLVKR